MTRQVVITGIGCVTPLGKNHKEVVRRIEAGESAAARPTHFDVSPFACPVCARVTDFRPQDYVAEPKMIRLMNRDAQLAVAAAHLALRDAQLTVGTDYAPDEIALFGATGLAGLPLGEVTALVRNSVTPEGRFDAEKFGRQGLRSISPLLSFKVLGNMPVCFVSICENIQGPNCIYTPWEGQGAQAIEAGMRAIQCGDARCALVGGCDVKTHELAFISLEQLGLFQSWKDSGSGVVPGEGAAFLVLEAEGSAASRGARVFARLADCVLGTRRDGSGAGTTVARLIEKLGGRDWRMPLHAIVSACDGVGSSGRDELQALASLGITAKTSLVPKAHVGNLFAAAAPLQVGLAAVLADRSGGRVLANCFGHGSEQAAFLLEKP